MRNSNEPAPPIPRFCPLCTRAVPENDDPLCPECGERVQGQGYCGVCQGFWRLPLGADCPKHEIPLDVGPHPIESPFAAGETPVWETVARYNHPSAAQAPRIRLEAEGIPAFLEGERMASHGLHHPAVGGVKLRVPRPMADEARVILAQSWSPITTDDDFEDWDDDAIGPDPGDLRRTMMRAVIVLILTLPLIRMLFSWLDR